MVDSFRNRSLRASPSGAKKTVSPWLSSYCRTRGAGMVRWRLLPIFRNCLVAGLSIAQFSTKWHPNQANSMFDC